jgi:hypothetical protein
MTQMAALLVSEAQLRGACFQSKEFADVSIDRQQAFFSPTLSAATTLRRRCVRQPNSVTSGRWLKAAGYMGAPSA